jgi:hypothetical protein
MKHSITITDRPFLKKCRQDLIYIYHHSSPLIYAARSVVAYDAQSGI